MGLVEMIKQIRLSLVDLYVHEDVMQSMHHIHEYGKYDLCSSIMHRIGSVFVMYNKTDREFAKPDKTQYSKEMIEEKLTDNYQHMLINNVMSMRNS